MNKNTLKRVRRKIENLRGNDVPAQKLEGIAISLGYVRTKGKGQTWVNELLMDNRPLGIHRHGKAIKKNTAGGILDRFVEDIYKLEELLEE
jgi:hypothetical protein